MPIAPPAVNHRSVAASYYYYYVDLEAVFSILVQGMVFTTHSTDTLYARTLQNSNSSLHAS